MCLGHCPHLPPPFWFGGKDIRCCQHVAHQNAGIVLPPGSKAGGTVKGMFLCKAAAQTGCEE